MARHHRKQYHRKDIGLLALRLGLGSVLFAHGARKPCGWFGGQGLEGTGAPSWSTWASHPASRAPWPPGSVRCSGALLALGLATPAAGAAATGAMAGAVSVHAPAGFFAMSGGFEYPAFLGYTAAGIGVAGPGRFSPVRSGSTVPPRGAAGR